ncbi:MAG: VWA domain-containing protein [Bacteroidota bacterium]
MGIQEIEKELEQEYKRFIEFGNLLDRRRRTYMIQYIQNKFEPEKHIIPSLKEQYYEYFQRALDKIFLIDGLIEVTRYSSLLKKQVILDTLYFLRKAYKQSRTINPFEDEQKRLESWAITPLHTFIKRWGAMPDYLSSVYDRSELDYFFFQEKFKELIHSADITAFSAKEKEQIEVLIHDVFAQWDALLNAKILELQLARFEEEQENYVELMTDKVAEYKKIHEFVEPFSDYMGWDLSRKLWQDTSFDILHHYNDLLEDEQSIKELADLLGKMREAEIELEEETVEKTIIRQKWVTDEFSRSEIVGVKESNELTNMLSSEASLLGDGQTELLFLKKYADSKLMTFRYEDQKLVPSEDHYTEINQRVNQKEKGPFIICVDTSESMQGRPEKIAKVLCLGILKMAMNQNRKAYLINFSTGIQTLNLHDIAQSIDEIAAFLRMSFYGGTDATLALHEAIRQLGTHEYKDADVLMVSDFIMSKTNEDVMQKFRYHQQNNNTQFHCLILGNDVNESVLSFFDTNWVYDPEQKGIIRSLTRGFHSIQERY